MADATISFAADAGNIPATIEQIRSIVEELFKGLDVDSERSAAIQEQLTQLFKDFNLTVLQTNDAVAALAPQLKEEVAAQTQASTATRAHSFNLKDLTKSFLGTISVVGLLKSNYDALKPSLEAVGSEFKNAAVGLGLSNDGASVLTNTLEMMVNPFTIIENLTANLKIASKELAAALYDEASAADEATEAQKRKAGILSTVLTEQQKLVAEEQRGRESLERRTAALERQIQVEQQGGEVKKFYLDKLKAILDEYDRRGETPPQKTLELADALGVLSSEQEKAATAAEKHAGKVREETQAVADSGSEYDKAISKLQAFTVAKDDSTASTKASTEALRSEIAALKEQADAANQAAGKARQTATEAQKRIAQLESQPVRTVDEQNELNSLKEQQVTLDQQASEAALAASDATFEYGQAQDSLAQSTGQASGAIKDQASGADYAAGVMAELDAATRDYQAAIQSAGEETASANQIIETVGENGERKFTNLAEAAGEYGDVLVQVGEDGAQSITNAANAAAKVPAALDRVAPAAEKAGEALGALNEGLGGKDGEETGLTKTAKDAGELKTVLEECAGLMRDIRVEAQRLNAAFSGAGTGA